MRVYVTGGCGYQGTILVPKLLQSGHEVIVFDIIWFGNFLEDHPKLTIIEGDVRDTDSIDLSGIAVHPVTVADFAISICNPFCDTALILGKEEEEEDFDKSPALLPLPMVSFCLPFLLNID